MLCGTDQHTVKCHLYAVACSSVKAKLGDLMGNMSDRAPPCSCKVPRRAVQAHLCDRHDLINFVVHKSLGLRACIL